MTTHRAKSHSQRQAEYQRRRIADGERRLTIWLDEDLYEGVRNLAKRERGNITQVIRNLILNAMMEE